MALNCQDSLTGTGSGILNTMQPSLDQLIQITRTLAHDDDFVRVVLASTQDNTQADTQGDVQFIEVSDGPEFRTELHQALRDGLTHWVCWAGSSRTVPCRLKAGCSPGMMRASGSCLSR